jgi:magnesium transporter
VPIVGDDGVSIEFLVGVCFEDRLVTFHAAPSASIERFVQRLEHTTDHDRVDSVSDLVAALFAHFSFELVDAGHRVKEQIDELNDRAHQPGGQLHATALHDLDVRFHSVDDAVDDHRHVLNILAGATNEAVDLSDTVPPFAIALGNIGALADDVDMYDRRLERLRHRYTAQLQERANHRINILTMISAIFLPLSLLAGIYGMNFEHMPGIDVRRGFWILMAVMLALSVGLAWFFRRRRWG